MNLNPCRYCGCSAQGEWTESDTGYKVECGFPGCTAWLRIYSHFKKYAEDAWNAANPLKEGVIT